MLAGCVSYFNQLTPEAAHQNFLRELQANVGQDIDKSNYTSLRRALRLSEERLHNGFMRYRYRSGIGDGKCQSIFDVDPGTNKIVAAGFEGGMKECSLPL